MKGWSTLKHGASVSRRLSELGFFVLATATFAGSTDDGFNGIQCGSDIAKALIGRHMANERVVVLEKRHADIGLKDLGADEISNRLSTISWIICGSEYMVLEEKDIVRDVIKIPAHSKTSPLFSGFCEMNGKENKGVVVAILDNEKKEAAADAKTLPAKVAWKIDDKKAKFVSLPVEDLQCPRSGIITADGGL